MKTLSESELKLAQMFMVGIPGVELVEAVAKRIRAYQPGGILFFAHNYETPALLGELSTTIQSIYKESANLPCFLAVDQEGGAIQNFGKPFTHFPEPSVLGAADSPKLAFDVADVMATELKAVGVNLDFWPLCDIHTRPSNPIIGRRAFHTTEEIVSKISSAIVRGFVKNGMVACVKHFPGHGDTTVDSHKVLPKVDMSWEQLMARELKPFLKAIRAKADMIMMAHILNPQIDPKYPASLSKETITNRLRKELRFSKLVIADDLQMEAITQGYSVAEAATLAIEAGNDILIYRDFERGLEAMDACLQALSEGKISAERVNESHARITEVKKRVLADFPTVDIENISKIVGCDAHKAVLESLRALDR
jgi:beta-N-acetylhexosaminidase